MINSSLSIRMPKIVIHKESEDGSNSSDSRYISIFFVVYLVIIFIAYMLEVWRFISSLNHLLTLIVAPIITIVIIGILFLKIKTIFISFPKINTVDLFVIVLFFGYFLLKLPFPDLSFDTVNYHIYLQEKSFTPLIGYDYFPAALYSTFYSLSDSVLFISRFVFGYRLGTVMNLFVFFVLYFGMKDIFTWTIGKGFRKESSLSFWNNYESKQLLSSGLAFLSVSSEYIMANFSIYMVDLIYLPLLLEVFKYVFYEKISINEFYLCSIYVGLSTAAKATNIIFSIPLLFVILAKNGRNLTIKQISTILSLAVLPLIIYVSFNLINTGNPIYFYYNKIFKSPYFPLENFKDTRWGPKNLLETVFYPIVIFDQNRVSELQLYSGRLSISFVFSVLIFIVTVINKKLRREFWFISVFLLMNYLWIISTGYVRYALFLELISIEIILFLLIRLSRIYSGSFIKAVLGLFLILISYQSVSAHKIILIDNLDWSVRPGIFDFIKNGNVRGFVKLYLENSRSILIDRYPYLNENDQRYVAQIDSWYVSNVTSGFTTILNKNIPFITGEDYYLNEKLKDIKRKYIEKQKSISTVADITTLQFAITSMNNGGLTISGIRFIYPNFLMSKQPLIVFQLKNEPSINSFVTLNKTSSYSINIENINNNSTFDAFFFQNPLYNNSDEIILKATLGEKIYYWNVSKKDVIRIHIEISGKYNTKAIVFEILDSKKESPGYGILLNPQFKTK